MISLGINDANYGINSSSGIEEDTTFTCAQITAHTSIGMYKNGKVAHGMSGGKNLLPALGGLKASIGKSLIKV